MSDFEKPTNQTKVEEGTSRPAPSEPAPANAESDFAHASQKWDASHGVNPTVTSNGSYASDQHNRAGAEVSKKGVREVLGDAREVVQRNYRVVSDSTDDFVHENPWKTVTFAALGGIVLGMLLSR